MASKQATGFIRLWVVMSVAALGYGFWAMFSEWSNEDFSLRYSVMTIEHEYRTRDIRSHESTTHFGKTPLFLTDTAGYYCLHALFGKPSTYVPFPNNRSEIQSNFTFDEFYNDKSPELVRQQTAFAKCRQIELSKLKQFRLRNAFEKFFYSGVAPFIGISVFIFILSWIVSGFTKPTNNS